MRSNSSRACGSTWHMCGGVQRLERCCVRGCRVRLPRQQHAVAVRQPWPSQRSLGGGVWGMQDMPLSSNCSLVFLLPSCKMSECVPDLSPGGKGTGKRIATQMLLWFISLPAACVRPQSPNESNTSGCKSVMENSVYVGFQCV